MYLTAALPAPGFFSAIEHGRAHVGTPEQRMKEWQRLKAQGVKTGLADLFIWYRGMFLPVELKVDGNDTSSNQDRFEEAMAANGFLYEVCRSVESLDSTLRRRNIPILPSMRIAAMDHDAFLSIPEKVVAKTYRPPRADKPDPKKLKAMGRARGRGFFA